MAVKYYLKASKHANRSNVAFGLAKAARQKGKHIEKSFKIADEYKNTHWVLFFSFIYVALLIAEISFSSILITPLADGLFPSNSALAYWVCLLLYGIIVFFLSKAAAEHLFSRKRQNVDFATDLEKIKHPHKSHHEIEYYLNHELKSSLRKGIMWTALLISIILALAIYRNYIVNFPRTPFSLFLH